MNDGDPRLNDALYYKIQYLFHRDWQSGNMSGCKSFEYIIGLVNIYINMFSFFRDSMSLSVVFSN